MKKWSLVAALLVIATIAALPAMAGNNGKGKGNSGTTEGHLVVPDAVYGDTVIASANPGGTGIYVLAKCFTADGALVWGGFFAVDANNQAAIGPISAMNWPNSDASCTADEGYVTRDGFGKWVSLASDTFNVAAR